MGIFEGVWEIRDVGSHWGQGGGGMWSPGDESSDDEGVRPLLFVLLLWLLVSNNPREFLAVQLCTI